MVAKEFGAGALLDCLERNERAGITCHSPGKLTGVLQSGLA